MDQIKEELAFKDALVTKVNMDRVNVEKEMESMKARQLQFCSYSLRALDANSVSYTHLTLPTNREV